MFSRMTLVFHGCFQTREHACLYPESLRVGLDFRRIQVLHRYHCFCSVVVKLERVCSPQRVRLSAVLCPVRAAQCVLPCACSRVRTVRAAQCVLPCACCPVRAALCVLPCADSTCCPVRTAQCVLPCACCPVRAAQGRTIAARLPDDCRTIASTIARPKQQRAHDCQHNSRQ